MEYQKIIKFLDNTPNETTKFRTKNWVEVNDHSRRTQNTSSKIKFKTSMLRSRLCDYGDAYILINETITITGAVHDDVVRRLYEKDKGIIFKNCAPFTDCISEINNTKYMNIVMPIYNLIKYSNNYWKTSGSLRQYFRDYLNESIT